MLYKLNYFFSLIICVGQNLFRACVISLVIFMPTLNKACLLYYLLLSWNPFKNSRHLWRGKVITHSIHNDILDNEGHILCNSVRITSNIDRLLYLDSRAYNRLTIPWSNIDLSSGISISTSWDFIWKTRKQSPEPL